MARGDDESAEYESGARAKPAVGDVAADERRQIDRHCVSAIETRGARRPPPQSVHEVQNEKGTHPVVREPLPHLGHEQQAESAWMAKERAVVEPGRVIREC